MTIPIWGVILISVVSSFGGFFLMALFSGRKISRLENAIIYALIANEFGNDHEEIMDGLRAALNGEDYDE